MKETFILRSEWWSAISKLDNDQKATILSNLFNYHMDGSINLSDKLVELVWLFIEPNLIRNIDSYEKRVQLAVANGKKGGRPKKTDNNPIGYLETDKKQIITLNDNVYVNDSVNVNVNDSVSDNINNAPTRDEFLSYCQSLDIDYERLKVTLGAKYDTWVADGWVNGYGKPIRDWKKTIINTLPHLKPMPVKQAPVTTKAKGSFGVKKGGAND